MAKQQVTTKDPKKVEAGKRLTEYNGRKREELKVQKSQVEPKLTSSQCYGIGAVLALVVIGDLGYYLYQAKVSAISPQQLSKQPLPQQPLRLTSLKWSKFLVYYIKWTRRV